MSAKNAKATHSPIATVADAALDQLECDKEYAVWLGALMRAIQTDAQHRDGRDSANLAGLGQYLADSMLAAVEDAASHLKSELNAVEGAV